VAASNPKDLGMVAPLCEFCHPQAFGRLRRGGYHPELNHIEKLQGLTEKIWENEYLRV